MHVEDYIEKIKEIKKHISNSKGRQKLQYIKCLHKLQKELNLYYILKGVD